MYSKSPLYFKNRQEWRGWLEDHHQKEKGVWLFIHKKHSRKPGIQHVDAVEESICFGWIDSKVKKLDEDRFIQWYAPRQPNSAWSLLNKKKAMKMIKQGMMTKAGLESINAAKENGMWDSAYTLKREVNLPDDLKRALIGNKRAWNNYEKLTDGYKNWYIIWVNGARLKETRERRIAKVVKRIAKNIKPGVP